MNYQVRQDDKSFGPFTLAELQAEVQSGRISANALVQSQGMTDWLPASQVLGDIPVPAAPLPKADHGGAAASRTEIPPLPPNLHWGWLLLLMLITNGLFNFIWAFVLGNWARKVEKDNKPIVLVAMYPAGLIGGIIAAGNGSAVLSFILIIGGFVSYLIGVFSIKAAIELYYVMLEKSADSTAWSRMPSALGKQTLSGVVTFFFSTVYLQYHINKIARWKKTGILRDTLITP